MTLRLFVALPLVAGSDIALPDGAARHVQVRRAQPGDAVVLFDGSGNDWPAEVLSMGRSAVGVRVGAAHAVHNELPLHVTLALGMPANERMDMLVEKATELGVACIQPLLTERSVLRLAGERAARKQAHWQAIAVAACEQCGRARVPQVQPVRGLAEWLRDGFAAAGPQRGDGAAATGKFRLLLSLQPGAQPVATLLTADLSGTGLVALSGPEGGLTADEEAAAQRYGFAPAALGPRVLRADTAPLALLAWLALAVRRMG